MSMQDIAVADLVHDEYGNYYEVLGIQTKEDTLKAIEVSNLYFEKTFQLMLDTEQVDAQYRGRPMGMLVQDLVNQQIQDVQSRNRPIYSLRDLLINKIQVYASDVTKPHHSVESGGE